MEERVRIGRSAAENGLNKAARHICQLLDCKLPKFNSGDLNLMPSKCSRYTLKYFIRPLTESIHSSAENCQFSAKATTVSPKFATLPYAPNSVCLCNIYMYVV